MVSSFLSSAIYCLFLLALVCYVHFRVFRLVIKYNVFQVRFVFRHTTKQW